MTLKEKSTYAPRPAADEIRSRMDEELSRGSRAGYIVLLIIDLLAGVVIASLWMTEPELPVRTHLAFGAMLAISLVWAGFYLRVLSRRGPFLVSHRIAGARIAVICTAVFTAAALLLAAMDSEVRGTALTASALGGVLVCVAAILLTRAKKRFAMLQRRLAQLETFLPRT